MPTERAHLDQANRNQSLLAALLPRIDEFPDWTATVAFYKALHVVEAIFANDPNIGHGTDHEDRERRLRANSRYRKIYKHYRPLSKISRVARYLRDDVARFEDWLPPARVVEEVLRHDLHQVEESAVKFLRDPSRLVRVGSLWPTRGGP